ncbi:MULTISPECIES: thiaminase II [unclassified Aureimonas]|uniref:thiaminase II n=1 Tax=unclassified Aureimonas TaxID=2615206 RepID=UPI0006FFAC51|nr:MULTISPECIES: thiaminase II [unclassified Aureimonas]KQT69656.1 thiaminase II [Aureimonas sp. Leaf427]KQT76190.1 thiaminase II [Aureimonas sp. Leaf460]
MRLIEHLKEAAGASWTAYIRHDYLRRLAENRLPAEAFRHYLVQDYLFLIQFARAQALAIYKSRTIAEMRHAQGSLAAILDVELGLHVRICAGWGLSPADLERAPEHAATVAYTRFVLDAGMSGDLLDLRVALAPCVVGYAEIAKELEDEVRAIDGHPQGPWVEEYAGAAYQDVAETARLELDRLGEGVVPPRRLAHLERIFTTACDLESAFWQMALDVAGKDRP